MLRTNSSKYGDVDYDDVKEVSEDLSGTLGEHVMSRGDSKSCKKFQ